MAKIPQSYLSHKSKKGYIKALAPEFHVSSSHKLTMDKYLKLKAGPNKYPKMEGVILIDESTSMSGNAGAMSLSQIFDAFVAPAQEDIAGTKIVMDGYHDQLRQLCAENMPQVNTKEPLVGPIRPYNAQQPFVLVNIGTDDPSRGDSHGFIGIARRIAEKIGGRVDIVDDAILEQYKQGSDNNYLSNYCRKNGAPDFYFSTKPGDNSDLEKLGEGIRVRHFNEDLPAYLDLDVGIHLQNHVSHHLTREDLEHQGRIFAQEYAELPRPFIGINLVNTDLDGVEQLSSRIGALKEAYGEATFFVCGTRRTPSSILHAFADALKENTGNSENFPVVAFDFAERVKQEGAGNFWNPYQGMLDQADHLLLLGGSRSIMSECVFTGKMLHTCYISNNSHCKSFLSLPKGTPLVTPKFDPPDVTGAVADAIIENHREHKYRRHTGPGFGVGAKNYPSIA